MILFVLGLVALYLWLGWHLVGKRVVAYMIDETTKWGDEVDGEDRFLIGFISLFATALWPAAGVCLLVGGHK